MSFIIPMNNYADSTVEVTLEGRPYIFRMRWNTRGAFWVLSISDRNEELIIDGLRLVSGFPINLYHKDSRLPKGLFAVVDLNTNTQFQEPGRNDFVADRQLSLGYLASYEL